MLYLNLTLLNHRAERLINERERVREREKIERKSYKVA